MSSIKFMPNKMKQKMYLTRKVPSIKVRLLLLWWIKSSIPASVTFRRPWVNSLIRCSLLEFWREVETYRNRASKISSSQSMGYFSVNTTAIFNSLKPWASLSCFNIFTIYNRIPLFGLDFYMIQKNHKP